MPIYVYTFFIAAAATVTEHPASTDAAVSVAVAVQCILKAVDLARGNATAARPPGWHARNIVKTKQILPLDTNLLREKNT